MNLKSVRWMTGEIKTPPFSDAARKEAGSLLWDVQNGHLLSMPVSRPMPSIGPGCHELRVRDVDSYWRVVYHIGTYQIAVLAVFAKKTGTTPKEVIDQCRRDLRRFKAEKGSL